MRKTEKICIVSESFQNPGHRPVVLIAEHSGQNMNCPSGKLRLLKELFCRGNALRIVSAVNINIGIMVHEFHAHGPGNV